jgi:glyoxylase-like metal-dependent hydrolase (beta-lactamase superfamily II)
VTPLFIGDVGRPVSSKSTHDADNCATLFHSLRKNYDFGDDVIVYPAHGACGKKHEQETVSTMVIKKPLIIRCII